MIIGINILYLIPNKVGGTEYYARSLLTALEKIDKGNSYVVFCNRENDDTFQFSSPKWKKVVCPVQAENRFQRVLFEQFLLPWLVRKEQCDVLHSLGYVSPFFTNCPQITTIHDANWKDMPQDVRFFERIILHSFISASALSTKYIVTDSIFASDRIQHVYPNLKDKIKIIQPGVDFTFLSFMQRLEKIKGKKYLLCVSGFYPHKNIPYLLKLWENLAPSLSDFKLVLVGQNGKDEGVVKKNIQSAHSVEWHPKVSLEILTKLYKSAQAFIFPSIYEGFGFPVYEALAADLPIFVGSKKPFQEISKELFELTFDVQKDTQLIKNNLYHHPRKNVTLPSYEKTAKQLISLYQDCLR